MTMRSFGSIGSMGSILGAAFAVLALVSVASPRAFAQAAAPKATDIPRLPNGKPDFSGIWDRPRVVDVSRDSKESRSGAPIMV